MGGAPAGERAAALVIAACEILPVPTSEPTAWLRERIEAARAAVAADERATRAHDGMGATVVLALVRDGVAWIAHAGDSRAYGWSQGRLERLTEDHNVAAEHVRDGRLTADEAMNDAGRHRLTRVVTGRKTEPEIAEPRRLDGKSVLLLVSDGISGTVEDAEIARCIEANCGLELVDALVRAAYDRGAPDNVAVALADARC